ncbi:unnamed protein product, partial [Discosporangium mesarthrocarpum]
MGDLGPCGPCSELHFDRIGGRDASSLVNMDDPNVLEIWNLVFIQFNREEAGLKQLPNKHVDTGMGLERLVSVLQGKMSNYDTDVFQALFETIRQVTGAPPYRGLIGEEDKDLRDTAYRVVADHARALSFAIADGALPSSEGRGYVLRRILRRAVRYGQQMLGAKKGFFQKLVPVVVSEFGDFYPELKAKEALVMEVVKEEEEAFSQMLERGIRHFKEVEAEQKAKAKVTAGVGGEVGPLSAGIIPGDTAFFLYDTLGFPLDLTQLMAEEVGMSVDIEGFQEEMATQKARSKEAEAARRQDRTAGVKAMVLGAEETSRLASGGVMPTDDDGKYTWGETLSGKVMALFNGDSLFMNPSPSMPNPDSNSNSNSFGEGSAVGVVLDATSFYAEAGGQVSDTGRLVIGGEG